jgi:hypothetical protein
MPPMTSAQPHQPQLVRDDADCRHQNTAAPAAGGNEAGLARPHSFQPAAPDGRRAAQKNEEKRIDPAEIGHAPVALSGEQRTQQGEAGATGVRGRQRLGQRQPEHAETIGHADA